MTDFDKLEMEWLTPTDELPEYDNDYWIEWQAENDNQILWGNR